MHVENLDVRNTRRAGSVPWRYGRRKALELILVCSHFNMVSRILESTRVEVEPENFLATWKMPQ